MKLRFFQKTAAMLAALFLTLTLTACSHGRSIAQSRYNSDKALFGELALYFKSLYTENLSEAHINPKYGDDGVLALEYKDQNGALSSEERNISSESAYAALSQLCEKYSEECEYPVFRFAEAHYDRNGNMILRLRAHAETLENPDIYGYYLMNYYLIYADQSYDGDGFYMSFDSYSISQSKPFSDSWYIWSEKSYIG